MSELIENEKFKGFINNLNDFIKNDHDKNMVKYCIFIKCGLNEELNKCIDQSEDRQQCYKNINDAIKLVKGDGFMLTAHGISRTIDGRFSLTKKAMIVEKINELSIILKKELDIESFITSGTLLGLVREGAFLGHDDDFDVAYISNNYNREKILQERNILFKTINHSENFTASERTGGRMAVTANCETFKFNFDLFTSWGDQEGFFNEFPLKPKTILFSDISPVKTVKFYGQDICVPNKPESLLEINYGQEWKIPDPTYRFKYGEHQPYYRFLMNNKIEN